MQSSKSEENEETNIDDTKIVRNNKTVMITIVDTNVEKEIKNVLVTNEIEQNEPSCSWKNTVQPSTEKKQQQVVLYKDNSSSSLCIPIDTPIEENSTQQKKIISSNEVPNVQNQPGIIRESNSLTNLFDGIEISVTPVEPSAVQISSQIVKPSPITQQSYQSQPVINQLLVQPQSRLQPSAPAPITTQPQPQLATPRNVEPLLASNRGIHVVNIPNDSINRALQRDARDNFPNNTTTLVIQRADQILGPPPSYSKSLLDRRVINPCASIQFVAPIPPPSYDGMENELRYAQNLGHTAFTLGLGTTWQSQPQPAYCPVCETVIITQIDVRVSRIAHIVAMIMFFLLCWPFCLVPYFLNICNYTFHYCSVCHSYLGARRPFQRG